MVSAVAAPPSMLRIVMAKTPVRTAARAATRMIARMIIGFLRRVTPVVGAIMLSPLFASYRVSKTVS
jgi:hypothetical protein